MRALRNKLKNKKILITGGLGFIGNRFIEILNDNCDECEIHIFDNFSNTYAYNVADELTELNTKSQNNISIFHLDINDTNEISYDYIVNLAEYNDDNGDACLITNTLAVYNLISRCDPSCKFLHVSTAKVYGDKSISDDAAHVKPTTIYGASKACADIIINACVNEYNKNISIVRLPNIFGPKQPIDKFIPNTILKGMSDHVIDIKGNDYSENQWVFIDDCCVQLLGTMIYGEKGEIYHILPTYDELPATIANIHLVKTILKILGKGEFLIAKDVDENSQKYESYLYGKNLLGLLLKNTFPKRGGSLNTDLRETITWYEKNKDWWY